MSAMSGVQEFYRDVIAPIESNVIMPVSRIDFLTGSGIAAAYLIQKVVAFIFFAIVNTFSGFQFEGLVDSFIRNAQEIPMYLGAIPVGLLGALFPQTVNESFVGIPSDGITIVVR